MRRAAHPVQLAIDGPDEYAIVSARGAAREIAREMGFGVVDQTRITTAVSEIVRNVVLYAGSGVLQFIVHGLEDGGPPFADSVHETGRVGLEIVVSDKGPGIADAAAALEGTTSSARGFGRGICGSRELMDGFELESRPGAGTTVRMWKWL